MPLINAPSMRPATADRDIGVYGTYVPTLVPKWDVLVRRRLPTTGELELEHRALPDSDDENASYTVSKLVGVLALSVLCPLAVSPVVLLVPAVVSWAALPWWTLVGVVFGAIALWRQEHLWVALGAVAAPPALATVLGLTFVNDDPLSRMVISVLVVASVVVLADSVATHAAWWMTARPGLSWAAVQRRRAWWALRFRPSALAAERKRFEADLLRARREHPKEASIIEAQLSELPELRWYGLGLLGAALFAVLAVERAPGWVAACSLPLVGLLLAYREKQAPQWWVLIRKVFVPAVVLWFSWGRWENARGLPTPGLFQSPRGPAAIRIGATALVCGLVSGLFADGLTLHAPASVLIAFILPALVIGGTILGLGARLLWRFYEAIETDGAPEASLDSETGWGENVARLAASSNPVERQHLWLGTHAEAGYPVLLNRAVLTEHAHLIGDSGSGKTARGLTPLVVQLIRQGGAGIAVIDLKGDMALFEAVREEAALHGRKFKYFTNVLGLSTHVFNPYRQADDPNMSHSAFVETIMESLRLNHGEGYGKRFFTAQGRSWLLRTIMKEPDLQSFEELFAQTDPDLFGTEEDRSHVLEVISVLQQLSAVEALNWVPNGPASEAIEREAINMASVVRDKEIVYFWLPAAGETSTVREIAFLALYSLFNAARAHQLEHGAAQTFLVIDEFQRMASSGFELILQQARSFGLGAILANQTISDLRGKDRPELLNVVQANTRFRQIFSATDPRAIEQLVRDSGEILALDPESGRARVAPRMSVNDVKRYSSDAALSIAHVTRDSGFSCFGGHWFGVKTDFHVSEETYRRRLTASWPANQAGTIVARRRSTHAPSPNVGTTAPEGVTATPSSRFAAEWSARLLAAYARRHPESEATTTC